MTKKFTLITALIFGLFVSLIGQDAKTPEASRSTPRNMWEVGVHGGYFFIAGDVDHEPSYGAGIHLRKATDYIFSIRLDLLYGMPMGKGPGTREFENSWMSGSVQGVFSLNNFRLDRSSRNFNLYALAGAGANYFETSYIPDGSLDRKKQVVPREIALHATVGAGAAVRISKRFNIGLEHQAGLIFGERVDQLDGIKLEENNSSIFRDIFNYTSLRLNFNLGNPSTQSEPLYWVSPLENVYQEIDDIKKRSDVAIEDADDDGVIDAIDQEPNTPPDVPVDTKGRTLDSDRDGVPDYKDKEPYYPPRAGEVVDSEGVVTNPVGGSGGVTEERVRELIDEAIRDLRPGSPGAAGADGAAGASGAITEMFLPMVHFGTDSDRIKYSDYGTLAGIARVLKGNTSLRLVIEGYADKTGPESYNNDISYRRAKSVVDHLVENHGIARGRLVLQWKGSENALVPTSSSYMNRRVEFRVARSGDVEMDPPTSDGTKSGGY